VEPSPRFADSKPPGRRHSGDEAGGSTIDGATYTVDAAGNRTSKADALAGVTSNYTYDAIYQLTQVTQSGNTTESYSYDPVGNRVSSLGVSPYAYNASNELTSTPSTSYAFDANGNTTSKTDSTGTTTYTWDYENKLTSVTLPGGGGTVSFKYDPFGRRIYKSFSSGTSIFAYDGDNLVEEANSSGTEVGSYSQGLNIDEPLAMERSSTASFYEADGLGSITSLSNSAGSLAQTYTFDSFGKQTAATGSLTNPFQYTARESDRETGLYYYRARYYDPSSGRFISEDPEGFNAAPNFYAYAGNDPSNWTDPEGLTKVFVCRQGLKYGHGLLKWLCHTFIKIVYDDSGELEANTYGILGDPGSRKNQIPRKNDKRNESTHCKLAADCADEDKIEKLVAGLEQSVKLKTCPSCGDNYQAWIVTDLAHPLDGYNSNTYTYNMLSEAGIVPPKERRCPGYHKAAPKSGSWY